MASSDKRCISESPRPANDDSTQWESFSFDLQPSDINNIAEKKESNQLSCSPTQSAMINMSLEIIEEYAEYNKQQIGKSCEIPPHPHSQSSDTECCNYQSTIGPQSVTTPSGNNSIQRKFLDNYNEDQPSTSSNTATTDYSAREWVKQGAPKEKLMIGMPTYGRSFELVNTSQFDIGAPALDGGEPGKYTSEAGFMSYYEICDFLHEDNTTLVWDNEQQVPFAYRGSQWVGFDDERSLKTKMAWLREEGFGGIMIWSVDMDDFRGQCGGGKYPLINAMRQELDGYKVKLEYDGPYESYSPTGQYTTKDPNEVTCEEEDGHISYHKDKADCTMYFMCEGERKHHMPCPSNLVFNPNENVCDWPENVEGCMQHTQAPPAK